MSRRAMIFHDVPRKIRLTGHTDSAGSEFYEVASARTVRSTEGVKRKIADATWREPRGGRRRPRFG
jgi:hypothetical protein